MGYLHIEADVIQTPKHPSSPCGDVVEVERTPSHTTIICCDGIGSGANAHIAATMYATRMKERIKAGVSLRKAFSSIVNTLHSARGKDLAYAVISATRIRNDGATTFLGYEIPSPVLISHGHSIIPQSHTHKLGVDLITEVNLHLRLGESLLIMSDGITQAGLGCGLNYGWGVEGVNHEVNEWIKEGTPLKQLGQKVHKFALKLWRKGGDDCTVIQASCREGITVNLFTGPPTSRENDKKITNEFISLSGLKVVCGATTAKIIAASTGKELDIRQDQNDLLAPPKYDIEGIDLVTEGAVTLNQLYNIIDENPKHFDESSGVTELFTLLIAADQVRIFMGMAANPANDSISFRQRGILSRQTIIPLLIEKLKNNGKLVTLKYV